VSTDEGGALADICHLGKASVLKAIDLLLDDGLIQFLHMVPTEKGSWKRRYRVTHPEHLEAQRWTISLFDQAPSQRAKKMAYSPADVVE
jgi:predicted transcriptional regulator